MLNFYHLEKHIESQMREAHVPGMALAIVQGQEVIYAKGFGVTSVEDGGIAVTPETLFRIGSITKPLTGTAIMRLVEAGKLDLDTPIKSYIDWFHLSDAQATEQVTLRMLLSHTSGLPTDGQHFGKRDPQGLEEFVREHIPTYKLLAAPNTFMSYSNPALIIAGYVLEVVGGKFYTDLMQELVFESLQMRHTTFDPTVAMTYPLAQSHDLSKDGKLSVQHRYADNVAHYPGGFAISTVMDLANFAIMQMHQGMFQGKQILSAESVQEMHKPQVSLYTYNDDAYGLTFFLETYKGLKQVRHDGGISTFGSRLAMLPEKQTAVIMTFNRWLPTVDAVTHTIFDQLLDLPAKAPKPQFIEPNHSLWSNYSGSYLGDWRGLAKIGIEDNTLTLKQNNDPIILLKAVRQDLYIGRKAEDNSPVSVGFLPANGPTQYTYINAYVHRRAELTTQPDPTKWQSYEGLYTLEGMDTYNIRLVENEPRIYSEHDNSEIALIPIDATRFGSQWGIFEFLTDDAGNISSVKQGPTWIYKRL